MDQKLAAVLTFLETSEARLRSMLHGFKRPSMSDLLHDDRCLTSSLSISFNKQQQTLEVRCDRCCRKISVNSDGFSIGN